MTTLTTPFWDAVSEERLTVQWCPACERFQWTPMLACARCYSEELTWREVAGTATVYSFSVVHRPQGETFTAPYVVAIVELTEGPRLLTTIVDMPVEEIAVGLPVRVLFRDGHYPFTRA